MSWIVESPRPSDRGLVARLLEDVLKVSPATAPEVAAGTLRAAQWLQSPRPAWAGVVVDPNSEARSIVGYASVGAVGGKNIVTAMLVSPAVQDAAVLAALRAAADSALSVKPVDEGPELNEEGLEIPPPTFLEANGQTPKERGLIGAMVIAGLGLWGVLAVQIGLGELGDALPFRNPSSLAQAAEQEDVTPAAAPAPPLATPPLVVSPGAVIPPATSSGVPQSPPPPAVPPTTAPPANPTPTPEDEPVVSSIVKPATDAIDETVGTNLSPTVDETVKEVEKIAKDTVNEVQDLVPPLPTPKFHDATSQKLLP